MHRKNGPAKAFCFKQFHIHHDRCAMKVGTDGVLLGAWAKLYDGHRILDIGTGSGLIALMLAQRTAPDVTICGVEIDKESCLQATENVEASPWPEKVKMYNAEIQKFESAENFDLIVCNPPYFINSFKPIESRRRLARHDSQLPFPELISSAKRLLKATGNLSLILPEAEGEDIIHLAGRASLFCSRKTVVKSKPTKPPERILCEFSFRSVTRVEDELILSDASGNWTKDYLRLVSPYYPWA